MRKTARIAAAAAGVAVALAGTIPSHAAGPYTIKGSRVAGVDGDTIFSRSGCRAEVRDAVNGVDTAIIDISAMAIGGKPITIRWTGDNTVGKAVGIGTGLAARFYNTNCEYYFINVPTSGINPGSWTITVPVGAKWMNVTANGLRDVSLSF